jgi:hypothetical protein
LEEAKELPAVSVHQLTTELADQIAIKQGAANEPFYSDPDEQEQSQLNEEDENDAENIPANIKQRQSSPPPVVKPYSRQLDPLALDELQTVPKYIYLVRRIDCVTCIIRIDI